MNNLENKSCNLHIHHVYNWALDFHFPVSLQLIHSILYFHQLLDNDILDISPNSVSFLVALPPSLNFLSITGDYTEGGILTASYGYVGGHEGKSIYSWYLHEVCTLLPFL